jgi:ribonuclease HII
MPRRKHKELELEDLGYQLIAGVDEAGRGAWAGPIVAGAAIFDLIKLKKDKTKISKLIRDSKILSPKKRAQAFELLTTQWLLAWGVGVVRATKIDQHGLTWANHEVMRRALKNLGAEPDYILIDAIKLQTGKIPNEPIIDGDAKILSIAAASIIAKVLRDIMMEQFHEQFPEYNFNQHKGYGTKLHQQKIKKHGINHLHRQSYKPIKNLAIDKIKVKR